jgi:tRNA threonylcarbamoyladenosine biosynthesis protein TsaB
MKNTLHIDTSRANIVSVLLTTSERELKKESEQKFGSQVLLHLIQELLSEADMELKDLTEITVATGPGSYTGLRVGVAVANALGYSLGIPVNGKKMEVDLEYA